MLMVEVSTESGVMFPVTLVAISATREYSTGCTAYFKLLSVRFGVLTPTETLETS
ncbi:hypothetical protein [Vibrio jasicida]|uniref:hypothetical protein n=1 Tax=Vibrio jasicida TaxID=766224 RepID=UPI001E4EC303|nr:hypothetical protein [Vibrio jasicida]